MLEVVKRVSLHDFVLQLFQIAKRFDATGSASVEVRVVVALALGREGLEELLGAGRREEKSISYLGVNISFGQDVFLWRYGWWIV